VETLSSQLREMEIKKGETENELKIAVTKIWELREIIRDLDQQVQSRSEKEDILNNQIEHLKEIIVSQTKNQEKLVQELEVVKAGNENNELSDHIGHLQVKIT
jgi:predicted  nucleic acid-binding Zn-ribbon protein